MWEVTLVDARYDITYDVIPFGNKLHGFQCSLEAFFVTPQPVVLFLQTVKADGNASQSAIYQLVKALLAEQHTIGNHSPRVTSFPHFFPHLSQVLTDKRFSATEDDHEFVRIYVWGNPVNHLQEIPCNLHCQLSEYQPCSHFRNVDNEDCT